MGVRARDVKAPGWAVWLARVAFCAVFAVNVACAVQFVAIPDAFAPGFQLDGVAGSVAVRGLGVAFLMWNVTYPLFIWRPVRYAAVGAIVLVQQCVGLVGETCILLSLPPGHEVLASSIARFVAFDAAGLVLMLVAFVLLVRKRGAGGLR